MVCRGTQPVSLACPCAPCTPPGTVASSSASRRRDAMLISLKLRWHGLFGGHSHSSRSASRARDGSTLSSSRTSPGCTGSRSRFSCVDPQEPRSASRQQQRRLCPLYRGDSSVIERSRAGGAFSARQADLVDCPPRRAPPAEDL